MKIVPGINSNGNSRQSLIDEAMAIHDALKTALKLVAESDLDHGRNYQTLPGCYGIQARAEKMNDCRMLRVMSDEYYMLAVSMLDKADARVLKEEIENRY